MSQNSTTRRVWLHRLDRCRAILWGELWAATMIAGLVIALAGGWVMAVRMVGREVVGTVQKEGSSLAWACQQG